MTHPIDSIWKKSVESGDDKILVIKPDGTQIMQSSSGDEIWVKTKARKFKPKFDTNEDYWRWFEDKVGRHIVDDYWGETG